MTDNELIARFMGMEGTPEFINLNYDYTKSWDLLMPVVQKIFKTDTGTMDVYTLYVADSLQTADIDKVYESVIDFIKWIESRE